jgi:antitoxin (DNA-binding transcriptional repressor) of toxin-antitoxin stability system
MASLKPIRMPISEVRRRLPELVRRLHAGAAATVQVTVQGEVRAELRAPQPEPAPGAAAKALLELMGSLPPAGKRKKASSTRVKELLYGRRRPRRG